MLPVYEFTLVSVSVLLPDFTKSIALFVAVSTPVPMEPAKVVAVAVALVSVTVEPPELMMTPPVPALGLLFWMRSTIWLLPFRSSVPPFMKRLSGVGMDPVGWTTIVLLPPLSLSVPPFTVVPFAPVEPV